ncbi:MAG: DUF1269 domain-containing protein [Proteobacteria bacterium]|nr:DUF1269 domain-containing protein [Pseudomonadota bacterium]
MPRRADAHGARVLDVSKDHNANHPEDRTMERRMYFVLPDLEVAKRVERDLLLARVDSSRMHFIGKRGANLGPLPEASHAQKSDIRHGVYVGLVGGAITGGAFGALLCFNPHWLGIAVNPSAVLLLGGFGALFGAFTSGVLIGSSTPNVHLRQFEADFEAGRLVLILDVPKQRVDELGALVKSHFPFIRDYQVDATIPAFP